MRTTIEKVRAIMEEGAPSIVDASMTEYIITASTLLDEAFTNVTASTTLLTELERWIAAHLASSSAARQAKEEGAGGAFIKYGGTFGQGLLSSSYGQTAVGIDITGTLAALTDTNRKTAYIYASKE